MNNLEDVIFIESDKDNTSCVYFNNSFNDFAIGDRFAISVYYLLLIYYTVFSRIVRNYI